MKPAIIVLSGQLFAFTLSNFSFVFVPQTYAQEHYLFQDPTGGQEVFNVKSCQKCHAIRGEGGNVAKDLGWNECFFIFKASFEDTFALKSHPGIIDLYSFSGAIGFRH